jgi:SHS2 domain-containing protein
VGFELRDHTADVAVAARGSDLGATFAAAADGLTAAMCESVPTAGDRVEITVVAESLEASLFDYLDELVYRRDVNGVLPAAHDATVTAEAHGTPVDPSVDGQYDEGTVYRVSASYRAVPLSVVTAREVKAVTYSEMRVDRTPVGWEAYVVFDV